MSQLKLSGDASGTGIVTVAAPNTNNTYTVTLPAAAGTLARTDAAQTFTGTQTFSSDASVNGLTVGRGAGAVASNTAVGASALAGSGAFNTAVGWNAMTANTSGTRSVAVGYQALVANLTGDRNHAFGMATLAVNTTGNYNTAVGYTALNQSNSDNNTAVGYGALALNTTASNNTAVGYQALYASNRTADTNGYNTAIGYGSGSAITTGQKNTILGAYTGNQSGLDIRTSSNYIVLSDGDGNPRLISNGSGELAAGENPIAGYRLVLKTADTTSSSHAVLMRNSASTNLLVVRSDGYISTGTAANSPYNSTTASAANVFVDSGGQLFRSTSSLKYKTNVRDAEHGLADLLKLRSVTYEGKSKNDAGKTFGGLIAEEVDAAGLIEFVQYAEDGSPDALAYGNMISLCIKAIQELKSELDSVKAELAALKA